MIGYYKDEKNVYFNNKIIENIDLETISINDENVAYDKNNFYIVDSNEDIIIEKR